MTQLKKSGLDIPFIIVSGTIGEEKAASSLRNGARDFVSKNDLSRLVSIIERELREASSRKLRQKVEQAYQASE